MTNNEAAKWIQLYIDLAKIDPTTGEAAYLNDDNKKTIEAMEMAVNTLTAQPEIIYCRDCKYWNPYRMECEGIGNWFGFEGAWEENGYCYKAERKTDGN